MRHLWVAIVPLLLAVALSGVASAQASGQEAPNDAAVPDEPQDEPSDTPTDGPGFDGAWTTSSGNRMELTRSGSSVTGPYGRMKKADENGVRTLGVIGDMDLEVTGERELKGFWIKGSASSVKCKSQMDGSFYWGQERMTFDESFMSWTGGWTYCDSELWRPSRGDRIGEPPASLTRDCSSDVGSLSTPQDQAESGVIVTGCRVDFVAPPGGVLELSREELPPRVRNRVATQGALLVCAIAPDTASSGDSSVLIDGRPVVRVGDRTSHGGMIVSGSDTIFVNGVPVAVVGSMHVCPMWTGLVPHVGGPLVAPFLTSQVQACAEAGDPVGFSRPWLAQDGRHCDKRIDALIDRHIEAGIEPTAENPIGFVIGDPNVQLPRIPDVEAPATRGSSLLEIDGSDLEIGDMIIIGDDAETIEMGRIRDKDPVVLDRPLFFDHARGTAVFRLPDDVAEIILQVETEGTVAPPA